MQLESCRSCGDAAEYACRASSYVYVVACRKPQCVPLRVALLRALRLLLHRVSRTWRTHGQRETLIIKCASSHSCGSVDNDDNGRSDGKHIVSSIVYMRVRCVCLIVLTLLYILLYNVQAIAVQPPPHRCLLSRHETHAPRTPECH